MSVLKELLPATVYRKLRSFRRKPTGEPHGERGSEWYDRAFENSTGQQGHYSQSPYYPTMTVILDRLRKSGNRSVLEIACGAGQLACALNDARLIDSYRGFDFSAKRIEQARKISPGLSFVVDDVFKTDSFETVNYDVVISTEFLEHVDADIEALARIRPGARFIGTVPNYQWESHVRHFDDAGQIIDRYGPQFDGLDVFPILLKPNGRTIFLLEGVKI